MNVNEAFPSKYVSAVDLGGLDGKPVVVRMGEVTKEILDKEEKLILAFQGRKKTMVLNKTNATKIADIYGGETDDWYDQPIELYVTETDFAGKTVEAVRVRAPRKERTENRASNDRPRDDRQEHRETRASEDRPADRGGDRPRDDDRRDAPPPRRAVPAGRDDMNDDIPF